MISLRSFVKFVKRNCLKVKAEGIVQPEVFSSFIIDEMVNEELRQLLGKLFMNIVLTKRGVVFMDDDVKLR